MRWPPLLSLVGLLAAACGGRSALEADLGGGDTAVGGGGAATTTSSTTTATTGGGTPLCTPTPEPVVLAEGQWGPRRLAVDGERLYWSDHDPWQGRIVSVPLGGGAVEIVAEGLGRPGAIGVTMDDVLWTDVLTDSVQRRAKAGGTVEELGGFQHNPTALAATGDAVFWANRGNTTGAVVGWSTGDETPTTVAPDQPEPNAIAIGAGRVWWLSAGPGNGGDGSLRARDRQGGPIALWAHFDGTRSVEVDDELVFVGVAGDILVSSVNSGPFEVLAEGAVASDMVSDGQDLYWANHLQGVGRVNRSGGGISWLPTVEGAASVAVDDECVYVAVGASEQDSHDGVVLKARKSAFEP